MTNSNETKDNLYEDLTAVITAVPNEHTLTLLVMLMQEVAVEASPGKEGLDSIGLMMLMQEVAVEASPGKEGLDSIGLMMLMQEVAVEESHGKEGLHSIGLVTATAMVCFSFRLVQNMAV
eukprot:TRINITY_DN66111_c0_g1_i1.p1 TRINITY_DN66111_c0_g1~~TRINITY_DN66111_c0_g1_i1.p1  ORF type:complete len:120 (-),score=33.11 TRINITY_DN66111_c0_g1_i1:62-421(-)